MIGSLVHHGIYSLGCLLEVLGVVSTWLRHPRAGLAFYALIPTLGQTGVQDTSDGASICRDQAMGWICIWTNLPPGNVEQPGRQSMIHTSVPIPSHLWNRAFTRPWRLSPSWSKGRLGRHRSSLLLNYTPYLGSSSTGNSSLIHVHNLDIHPAVMANFHRHKQYALAIISMPSP